MTMMRPSSSSTSRPWVLLGASSVLFGGHHHQHHHLVKAQVPVDDTECPLACANGSTCVRHTTTSQGQGFDPIVGEIYWHDNNSADRVSYFCQCTLGFTGIECNELVALCNPDDSPENYLICENGGQCIEGQDDFGLDFFVCDCTTNLNIGERYVGQRCEIPVPRSQYCLGCAVDDFCVRGGTCRLAPADDLDIQPCDCPEGRTGKHCEFSTAELSCDLSCQNGGICRHGQKRIDTVPDEIIHAETGVSPPRSENYMFCECQQGYAGLFCEYQYTTCGNLDHYCFNGSVCQDVAGANNIAEWECVCDIGTSPAAGDFCEFAATDDCSAAVVFDGTVDGSIQALLPGEEFCVNGGQCTAVINDSGDQTLFCNCDALDSAGIVHGGRHCESRQIVDPSPTTSPIMPTSAPVTVAPPTAVPTIQPTEISSPTVSPVSSAVCNPEAPENERIICLNGGLCVVRGDGSFGCICPDGFTGPQCESVQETTAAPVPAVPTSTPTLSAVPTVTPMPSYPLLTFSPGPTTTTRPPAIMTAAPTPLRATPATDAPSSNTLLTTDAPSSSSSSFDSTTTPPDGTPSAAGKSCFGFASYSAAMAVLATVFLLGQ